MKTAEAISEILRREGVELLIGYPVNHLLEYAARIGIRPIIVRQERTGLHMADAISRVTSGRRLGVFAMQHGPGTENAYGGIAQAYGESVPILVLPMGYPRRLAWVPPNYNASLQMRGITKSAEPLTSAAEIPAVFRRAFQRLRAGRGGPVLVEIPTDVFAEELATLEWTSPARLRLGPDPEAVRAAVDLLLRARRPVLYAGQGVHWAEAWDELHRLAERLAIPVSTSLQGKSAFDETHPLALGSGGRAIPETVHHFLERADLILAVGASLTESNFAVAMPKGVPIVHATLDPMDVNKDVACTLALLGDAKLTLEALIAEVERREGPEPRDPGPVAAEIAAVRARWLERWLPELGSDAVPLSPYRVLWDLQHTVDVGRTIVTHDAGSPRDQLSPFWRCTRPLTYLGWGKTTQLGYGLGLAMGAKLARPDHLCINVWGDAAIGFTGMDLETAVRERIPILSILLNNFCMAIELKVMPESTRLYRATDISGDYAAMMRAFGGYGERIERPADIVPAIRRGIEATERGQPALLEFVTAKEERISSFKAG